MTRSRLLVDLVVGAAAGGIAYFVALPKPETALEARRAEAQVVNEGDGHGRDRAKATRSPVIAPRAAPAEVADAGVSIEERRSMLNLRNEAIRVSSEDMHRRGVSVLGCVDGVVFAGAEKLRFAAEVVSTPMEATIERWRFLEVAEGEPLPASFAECAARAFGGGQHLVAAKDFPFPDFTGEVQILYTIPAPASR